MNSLAFDASDIGPNAAAKTAPVISFAFARKQALLLDTQVEPWRLWVCEATPKDAILEVQRLGCGHGVGLVLTQLPEAQLRAELERFYSGAQSEQMAEAEAFEVDDLETVAAEASEAEDLLDANDDAPIIKLLNAILAEAIRAQASDIHIEPFENRLRIRFRLDGQLKTMLTPKKALTEMLVSRIKVMAKLDIAEKRLPQDGRMAIKLGGRSVDLRISTIPSSFGERVVMRLLDKSAGRLTLGDMGLPDNTCAHLRELLHRPHGIVLVTGPTGSGKTTTLYAGLSEINDQARNIMTVEDPVEYNLDGINQTQVNAKADMTFARGLRAILRQDPDVVMIGEIRDRETADIAVQSSLTGHLVLSTLHTNTAIGAVTRLRDMGVEPFLLASSLNGVMAQRLVRRLCPECKQPHTADAAECEGLGVTSDQAPTIAQAQGCEACHHTGYQGRLGLYELIVIDDTLRQMIHSDASESELDAYAHQSMPSIHQNGRDLVLQGATTLEEVLRVTQA